MQSVPTSIIKDLYLAVKAYIETELKRVDIGKQSKKIVLSNSFFRVIDKYDECIA
jgi:hypothetical protein